MKKVEVKVRVKTTPENIISAFTNPDKLRTWWLVERALIDKKPDGLYTLAWNITENGFGYVSTGIIKEYKSGRELVIDHMVYLNPERPFFGPMKLTVRAEKKNETTMAYICQEGYQEGKDWDWYYSAVKQAWPAVIQRLKEYLEK
ncbi:MAG: SRPBCC domain-containing protein [Cyclobacteriaceae bacterium]|nr:SRPBCC domain-containing protein [Cyclobacteriaceae bacterium]